MRLRIGVGIGVVVVALGLFAGACGDSGDDDRECGTCTVSEDCENDQECIRAADDNLRCFEPDREVCTLGRVPVGRAPTPTPTPVP